MLTPLPDLTRDVLRFRSLIAGDVLLLQLAEAASDGRRHEALLLRTKSDLAFRRLQLALVEHFSADQKSGFRPDQPRVPAGDPAGGQWTSGDASENATPEPVFLDPRRYAVQKTIEAGLALYTWLSTRNATDSRAVATFKAKAYGPDGKGEIDLANVAALDRDQVDAACPRLEEVQERTDIADRQARGEREYASPKDLGTAVHTNLKRQIDSLQDPDFRAEVSYLKNREDNYGKKDSIRVDILEKVGSGDVCVYDIKTGRTGLSLPRMAEIATNVFGAFPETRRIIVTEIRPRR